MKISIRILLVFSALVFPGAGLAAQTVETQADSTASADSAGMFNALDYSMQKRYLYRGEPFINNRFTDNTFFSIHGGSEKLAPRGNSTYNWSAAAKISYGKWFNPYNALRLTLIMH